MVDHSRIVSFEWDEGNSHKSAIKHAVSQEEAEQVFANEPLLLFDDVQHSDREDRFHAYGRTNAVRLLQVSFTIRQAGTAIRVISTRDMSRKERERYEEEA